MAFEVGSDQRATLRSPADAGESPRTTLLFLRADLGQDRVGGLGQQGSEYVLAIRLGLPLQLVLQKGRALSGLNELVQYGDIVLRLDLAIESGELTEVLLLGCLR